ncbi:hypothetical protein R3P38DRAFT_3216574 [Favolaschia claudopus]|uniref:F-box domain-containing protein n=1 Tax=Favolaschia claudopus TaxID=2862362 RepID=A0AAW0A652_9AGAR
MSASLTPSISKMPTEVLTETWSYFRHSPSTLNTIVKVSRQWRWTAIGTPTLWQHLHLTESTPIPGLLQWVERGQDLRRFIYLDFRRAATHIWISDAPDLDSPSKIAAILSIVKGVSQHCVHLEVFGPYYLIHLLDLSSSFPAPLLTSLSIILDRPPLDVATPDPSEANTVLYQTTALSSVTVVGFPVAWGVFPFTQLTSLTFGRFATRSQLPWDKFCEALSGNETLEALGFVTQIPFTSPLRNTSASLVLRLPSLRQLSLAFLSSLEVLHLMQCLEISSVNSLAIAFTWDDEPAATMQECFERLHTWLPHITTLAVDTLQLGTTEISFHLNRLVHLSTLRMNFADAAAILWCQLLDDASEPEILPHLTTLELVDVAFINVQELIWLRRQATHKISVLVVHLSLGFGWAWDFRVPAWRTWLTDNTESFTLIEGTPERWIWGTV